MSVKITPEPGGRLIGVQTIVATGAGTYTPTPGTKFIIVELQGAGGGAGSADQTTGGVETNATGGAGAGGYIRHKFTQNFSGASYSVGALGAGGAAGAAGSNGGDTTFTDTAGAPTTYTAGGGVASTGTNGFTTPFIKAAGAGGVCTNGDIQIPGQAGTAAVALNILNAAGGVGGSSFYSNGGAGAFSQGANVSNPGGAAGGKGGGGGGAAVTPNAAAASGGNGSNGMIIVWEYGY